MTTTATFLHACPTADTLRQLAVERTGFDDFGDVRRDTALRVYMESVAAEVWPVMTERARRVAVDYLLRQLENRLLLQADRARYPEITAQTVRAPLIVVGPPRSGSTLLHTLLSLDPDHMAPAHWLCREPCPPPRLGPPSENRLQRADECMATLFNLIPDVFVTHPYMIEEGSGALAECGSDILSMVFTSQQLWCFWGGEQYRRYLLEADHTTALAFHREFLQHAQWGQSHKRWVLKGSDHMLWLMELARQYPDARLIWTHRDLAQQLGSLASVQSILLGLRGQPVTAEDRHAQGRRAIELQLASVEKAMHTREQIGEERFLDISYHDMMSDHVAIVERIYQWAEIPFTEAHARRIQQWQAMHHQTKHGVHRHSPEDFGMNGTHVNELFARYRARFGFGFGERPPLTV